MITLGFKRAAGTRPKRFQPKIDSFLSMCVQIGTFMQENDGGEFKAFISPTDAGSLRLYLITGAETYDFALSAKLAEFAAPYIERGLLDSVALLPASSSEELAALFDSDSAVRIEIQDA